MSGELKKRSLSKLNKEYKVRDLKKILLDEFGISKNEFECIQITQNFIDKYGSDTQNDFCIYVEYDNLKGRYAVVDEIYLRTADWFLFLPFYVCFRCEEKTAFAVVLLYMNEIRADVEDLRLGLREMVTQLCRNEIRYKQEH